MRITLYIGIDPAQRVSGVAYQSDTWKRPQWRIVDGIERMSATWTPDETNGLPYVLTQLANTPGERAVACVEYPPAGMPQAPQTRSAANAWIRWVKALAPGKVTIYKVNPNRWQCATLGCSGRAKTAERKELSLFRAKTITPDLTDHNASDAVCLLEYGRVIHREAQLLKGFSKQSHGGHIGIRKP